MTLNRWRGTCGLLGWLTMRWDVWMLRRDVRRMTRIVALSKQRMKDLL